MVFDKTFWLVLVFPLLALIVAGLIVWWTLPRKPGGGKRDR